MSPHRYSASHEYHRDRRFMYIYIYIYIYIFAAHYEKVMHSEQGVLEVRPPLVPTWGRALFQDHLSSQGVTLDITMEDVLHYM